jgi:predicted ribosome-associated RNA-binding protein Tma20
VVFTTIQKFLPEDDAENDVLSARRNIVVIADEAHRSQYGFRTNLDKKTGKLKLGLAKQLRNALPGASFIGFTGTPIELTDKNTVEVFGDYISVYDIKRAVEDGATVPILYENRLVKLDLDESEKERLDATFEEVTETEEVEAKEALKSDWSTLEALVGTEDRLGLVAKDLVEHFEKRLAAMDGKGLVVCMSRRICVDLYDALVKLRPAWGAADLDAGALKVVMTGSAADPLAFRPHVYSKAQRDDIAARFKDPADPLRLVIVRDMWLTGFDAPCLHTLYVDKPMRGHNLAQAIARVNRVFRDKPAGLVVDYIGIATMLKEAVATYSQAGGEGKPTSPVDDAAREMLSRLEICRDVFHGFDYQVFFHGTGAQRLALLPPAREHVLAQQAPSKKKGAPSGHDRFFDAVAGLTTAAAMASTHPSYDAVRDEIAFFQAVKAGISKLRGARALPTESVEHAVRQLVANAIVTDEIIDVYSAAGLQKPDISVLSEEFLAEVAHLPHKNLAFEALRRLLQDQVNARKGSNLVVYRQFSERLEAAVQRYRSRAIDSVTVVGVLIDMAREFRESGAEARAHKLSTEEAAFFDALAANGSAKEALGDTTLALIARELARELRAKATIDWNRKENVKAKLRIALKKILKKHGYPPDGQAEATELVLVQAEALGVNVEAGAPDLVADQEPTAEPGPSAWTGPTPELPYPLAIWQVVFAAQEDGVLRVKTRRDAFEKALTFVAGVTLALLREANGGELSPEARAIVSDYVGKPLSMGAWHDVACRLAALVPVDKPDPLREAVRCLVTTEGKPSDLALAIKDNVVKDRNLFAHTVTLTKEAVLAGEEELSALWRRFEAGLRGLREARVVAMAKILGTDLAAGRLTYHVRDLHGASEHFAVREQVLRGELREPWVHLVRPGELPLSLAPVVACETRKDGAGRDVFLARSLVLEPTKKLELSSVTRGETVRVAYAEG